MIVSYGPQFEMLYMEGNSANLCPQDWRDRQENPEIMSYQNKDLGEEINGRISTGRKTKTCN